MDGVEYDILEMEEKKAKLIPNHCLLQIRK